MFDVNTSIGHWPFRQLENNTPETLKNYLLQYGITGAAVAHNHAACYMNVQDANWELFRAIEEEKSGFFRGIATLNPLYAAWEKDLRCCAEQLNFRALRLLPAYHNYQLSDAAATEIITAAGELGLLVVIPNEIVNYRQRHWMENGIPQGTDTLIDTARRFPQVNFLFTEANFPEKPSQPYPGNAYFEMSRFRNCFGRQLDNFIQLVGADHVLFGSGAPFKEIEPALIKLHHCRISEADRELIAQGNAQKWFDC
ncbi:MAG: hypothetical protein E7052_03125 [Lentisphaerae bacterium]|nr:hypothetical protein [Lentisphaerota bacterium]